MENALTFDSSYRQLDAVARLVVDDLVARVEQTADRTGKPLFEVLGAYEPTQREHESLARPIVKAAIFERVRDLTEQQNISPRRILKEIAAIAFGNIDHFRKPHGLLSDGGIFELDYATPEQRAAVKEVEIEENARTGKVKLKFKLHDKLSALRMLGQIQGLFDGDGNPTNSEAWQQLGGIPITSSTEESIGLYARFIDGE